MSAALCICALIALAASASAMPHTSVFGLTGTYYNNTAALGTPALVRVDSSVDFAFSASPIAGNDGSFFSVVWTGRIVAATSGNFSFAVTTNGAVRLWVADHLLVDDSKAGSSRTTEGVLPVPLWALSAAEIRIECVFFDRAALTDVPAVKVTWGNATSLDAKRILTDGAALWPDSSDAEVQRRKLYADLQSGWGTHVNDNMLAFALLPEGFSLELGLYDTSTGEYVSKAIVGRIGSELQVLPGPHTRNPFYAEVTRVSWRGFQALVQASAGSTGDLAVTVTPLSNASTTVIVVASPTMAFGRAGNITVDATGTMLARMPGFESILVTTAGTPATLKNELQGVAAPYIAFAATSPIAFCVQPEAQGRKNSLATCNTTAAARVAEGRRAAVALHEAYGNLSDAYAAMRTVVSWNSVYVPQEGTIVTPVSRGWDYSDAGYVLFDWDTYFCALMAAIDDRALAYANLIQMTKALTPFGFVPNEHGGVSASWDRTEPSVGAVALLAIYNKYGDDWLVDLLFDDLFAWNTWMWQKRRTAEGLIQLGSDPNVPGSAPDMDTMQAARYESGLDNSPMYSALI
eukprot:Opistho-1_new@70591